MEHGLALASQVSATIPPRAPGRGDEVPREEAPGKCLDLTRQRRRGSKFSSRSGARVMRPTFGACSAHAKVDMRGTKDATR